MSCTIACPTLSSVSSSPRCLRAGLLLTLAVAGCSRSSFPTYPEGYREFAYIANRTGNSVTVLDLVYLRPDRTLSVGASPVALAVNPRRDEVYVVNAQPASASGSISVLDTRRNTIAATIPVHRDPASISIDASGQRAYVVNTGSNTVSVLDLDLRREIASYVTGEHPSAAQLSADGRTLVVANRGSGTVSLFSANGAEHSAPPLVLRATFPGCSEATSPVILPDSSKAFVACSRANQVLVLSLAAAPGSWAARQDATLLQDHVLALLDVGKDPEQLTLKPDGGEIFVSNLTSDSVSEISTQTNEVGSTFAIGDRPAHGLVSEDGSALWISNSGADSLSLYSISDGKLISSLRLGSGPDALAFSSGEHLLLAADTRSGDIAIIRTTSKLGPALLTMLPAGGTPSAIVVKAMPAKP